MRWETYKHCYPVRWLSAKTEHYCVHSSRWNSTNYTINHIKGSQISPYCNMLQYREGTARWKPNSTWKLSKNIWLLLNISYKAQQRIFLLSLHSNYKSLQPNTARESNHWQLFHLTFVISICMNTDSKYNKGLYWY